MIQSLSRMLSRMLSVEQVEDTDDTQEKRLLSAASAGDINSLRSLIDEGVSVDTFNLQGSTPLHLAVKGKHTKCVELLLQQPNIDLQSLDRWGRSPMHTAVIWPRLELLKLLIELKPECVDVADADGKSVLHIASATGCTEFVKYLMTTKINKNGVDHRRWTPLMCAVAIQSVDTVKVLLEGGAECNEPLRHNACMSALRLAIEKHNLEIVKLLLDYGAMVEFTVTVNLGSFKRSGGRRYSHICHNLATVAIENVHLTHMQSIEIAYRVIQSSPAAPDEDACLKMYEMHVKPSRRLQRLVSRELMSLIETITPSTISQIYRLLSISFAVGIDLSKSNVDRLKRKFRLDEKTDARLFKLIEMHRNKNLKLLSALAIRKQLLKSGHHNITSALNSLQLPHFLREIVDLDWY